LYLNNVVFGPRTRILSTEYALKSKAYTPKVTLKSATIYWLVSFDGQLHMRNAMHFTKMT